MPGERLEKEMKGRERKKDTRSGILRFCSHRTFLCEFFRLSLSGKIHGKKKSDERCKEWRTEGEKPVTVEYSNTPCPTIFPLCLCEISGGFSFQVQVLLSDPSLLTFPFHE